jgi:hypothetical protein
VIWPALVFLFGLPASVGLVLLILAEAAGK